MEDIPDLGILPGLDALPSLAPLKELEALEIDIRIPDLEQQEEDEPHLDVWDLEEDVLPIQPPKVCTWEILDHESIPEISKVALLSESGPAGFDAVVSLGNIGVLPHDYALRALCNLVLGRSSSLFQWDPAKKQFEQTFEASISALSSICCEAIVADFMELGNLMSRLRTFASLAQSFSSGCSAFLALRSCTTVILDAVEEEMSQQLASTRSILQLRNFVAQPWRLLQFLDIFVQQAEHCQSDGRVISAVFDALKNGYTIEFADVFRSLLSNVSAPWLEDLTRRLGFCDSNLLPLSNSKSDGNSDDEWINDCAFISREDVQLIRQTISAVELLQATSPEDDLLKQDLPTPSASMEDLHAQVTTMWSATSERSGGDGDVFSEDSTFAPLERVRPLMLARYRLVNEVLMRQLFREHQLPQHLQLQYSFQLLGDGYFVDRLSTALFSSNVQTAERRRDQRPTGEIMGLRLGTSHEERWPPASSELQLALMGILNEAYLGTGTCTTAKNELPGSLSFAIRELPEEEIERVLDPNSIYALDFLRLQYTPSAPLDAIFSTEALQSYDRIFRFLLRLLRVAHVISNFSRQAGRGTATIDKDMLSFITMAQHFVSVLLSHSMDVGISAIWHDFMTKIGESESVEGLRQLHTACLDDIRTGLFLKRKQAKSRDAIDAGLTAVLRGCFTDHRSSREIQHAISGLEEQAKQNDESVRILLARLK